MEIDHLHFPEISSTNDYAKSHLADFSKERLTIISADSQLSGRGRFGRPWLSSPGVNITSTFCFCNLNTDPLYLIYLAVLAAAALLEEEGMHPRFKYPNDLIVSDKKVAGVLLETLTRPEGTWVVLGLGLNVNMTEEMAAMIDQPVTSFFLEDGKKREVAELRRRLHLIFSSYLDRLLKEGFSSFLPEMSRLGSSETKQ